MDPKTDQMGVDDTVFMLLETMKSNGTFDEFRRQCVSDIDAKVYKNDGCFADVFARFCSPPVVWPLLFATWWSNSQSTYSIGLQKLFKLYKSTYADRNLPFIYLTLHFCRHHMSLEL